MGSLLDEERLENMSLEELSELEDLLEDEDNDELEKAINRYMAMDLEELINEALNRGIEIYDDATKEELIETLIEYDTGEDSEEEMEEETEERTGIEKINEELTLKEEEKVEQSRSDLLKIMEYGDQNEGNKQTDTLYDSEGTPVCFQTHGEIYTKIIYLKDILVSPRTRTNTNINVEDLEDSILRWGLVEPLHVMPFENKYILIHGYRRLKALRNLNFKEALCLVDTTRPKTTLRFLEVIHNNSIKYNLFEILAFGEFIERKQTTFQTETIEKILGMEPGDYIKAKYIRNFDNFGIMSDILRGRKTIKEGFKKLEKELEKLEKERNEQEDLTMETLNQEYDQFLENEPNIQTTDDRKILPKHIRDRIRARDKYTCQSCGLGLNEPELASVFEIHHIVPVFKKGSDDDSNLILVCSNCHKVIHAYAKGEFLPSKEKRKYYLNMIVLGNIINMGVANGKNPYTTYISESKQPWVNNK